MICQMYDLCDYVPKYKRYMLQLLDQIKIESKNKKLTLRERKLEKKKQINFPQMH